MLGAVGAFGSALVLVSPEVGLTVVPATASGRRFADELGTLNQRIAALCDRVVLVVAGQPVVDQAAGKRDGIRAGVSRPTRTPPRPPAPARTP